VATPASLLRQASRSNPPETGLPAVRALKQEIEALERHHVASAISEGWSWARVAAALEVTKQAAHKRHAQAVRALIATDPREAVPSSDQVVVTADARHAVRMAREEARTQGATTVGTEHLLVGVLRSPARSPAVAALTGHGVTLRAARAALCPTLLEEEEEAAATSRATAEAARATGVSALARLCLEDSLRQATRRSDGHLGIEHLLLALLARDDGGAARTLERLGVSAREIRGEVAARIGAAGSALSGERP
jgi:ATP-dependent Clp protease ATP-binding subunit ClpA